MRSVFLIGLVSAFLLALPVRSAGLLSDEVKEAALNHAVTATTGINPEAYPCAREGIIALYEKRENLAEMAQFDPRRLFVWVMDTATYYAFRLMDFIRALMDPQAVQRGLEELRAMARAPDPAGNVERQVRDWADELGHRTRYVLQEKAEAIVRKTTLADGRCRKD